jgi:hypothetical protein
MVMENAEKGNFTFLQNVTPFIRGGNGWEPSSADYYSKSDTIINGVRNYLLGKDGRIEKEITMYFEGYKFTGMSIVIMNQTYTTSDGNWIDTIYYYSAGENDHFNPRMRIFLGYHYFDKTPIDSFYQEQVIQFWDQGSNNWRNHNKIILGYNNTLVEFPDRASGYIPWINNTWKLYNYLYDSVSYNEQGHVEELFMNRMYDGGYYHTPYKIVFTNDEQGRYTHMTYYEKQGNDWVLIPNHPEFDNITWKEWNGFTYSSGGFHGGEIVSPYKRTKIHSEDVYFDGEKKFFREKSWDVDGTKTHKDSIYYVVEDKLYIASTEENIYNEHGDYVEWRNTAYSYPDENGKQTLTHYSAMWYLYEYLDIYGLKKKMSYQINFDGEKFDTLFLEGIVIKSYQSVSITDPPQSSEPTLRLVPNPVSGMVTISTTAEMQQLNIFDITGRLVGSQSPAGNQVVFDTGVLPKGVYLVQALLKDGGQRTGKMVVK